MLRVARILFDFFVDVTSALAFLGVAYVLVIWPRAVEIANVMA